MPSVLSVFPELFSYGFFAPTILRLGLAVFFFSALHDATINKKAIKQAWPKLHGVALPLYRLVFAVIGILFLIGLYTQIAALLGVIAALKLIAFRRFSKACAPWAPRSDLLYFIVLTASLALLLLGPGAFAFDLPL